MQSRAQSSSEWVSIGRASALLGVNPATLRQWSATGKLHAYRTVGGHRRFSASELASLAQSPTESSIPSLTEEIIGQLRQGYRTLAHEAVPHQSWIAGLGESSRRRFHELGDALLERLGEYIAAKSSSQRRRSLGAARIIACEYGQACREAGIETGQVIDAYVLFRRPLLDVLARSFSAHPEVGGQLSRVMRDAEHFMDELLAGIVGGTAAVAREGKRS